MPDTPPASAAPAPVVQGTRLDRRIVIALFRGLVRLIVRPRLIGIERLPKTPYVLAANHMSYADSLILGAFLPRTPRVCLIGNQFTVWDGRWKSALVDWHGGVIPVDLKKPVDLHAFRQAVAVLQAGNALVIFPEADTGNQEGELLPFRPGAAAIAQRAGVPLIPVGIRGTSELWLGKELFFTFGEPRLIPAGRQALEAANAALPQQVKALIAPAKPVTGPRPLRHLLTNLL